MGRRGKNKSGRKVNGLLLLDKPAGLTSNEVLQKVKRLFQAQKAGHTGSLDKMATGLLPLCFGEGTKFSGHLLDSDKEYHAVIRLGRETTTGDEEGDTVVEGVIPSLNQAKIEAVFEGFRGEIEQLPPMFSALKHKGKRLYELAYQGIEVERQPRPVTIYELTLLNHEDEFLTVNVRCSKGTYIRTLAQDIGRKIGCGACVHTLRRTAAGPYTQDQMITVQSLESLAQESLVELDNMLLGIDSALVNMPEISVNDQITDFLQQGQAVIIANSPTTGFLRIYSENKFLGLGEVLEDGRIAPRRLVSL
jgi:tRNA pseudouridine55 synthase